VPIFAFSLFFHTPQVHPVFLVEFFPSFFPCVLLRSHCATHQLMKSRAISSIFCCLFIPFLAPPVFLFFTSGFSSGPHLNERSGKSESLLIKIFCTLNKLSTRPPTPDAGLVGVGPYKSYFLTHSSCISCQYSLSTEFLTLSDPNPPFPPHSFTLLFSVSFQRIEARNEGMSSPFFFWSTFFPFLLFP